MSQFLIRLPIFAITYAATGALFAFLWLRENSVRALQALSGVILAIAALNGYAEEWSSLKSIRFENAALLLIAGFVWPYSVMSVRLMQQAGVARGRKAFLSSVLPLVYLTFLGMILLNLRDLSTADNPPLAMYVWMIFICALHVPCFAAGKSKTLENQRKTELSASTSTSLGLPIDALRQALLALAIPLCIVLAFQLTIRDDWELFFLDFGMSVTVALLFLIASNRGWNIWGFGRHSALNSKTS